MKNWKQGLTSLLAVTMLGSVVPAALAAEVPTEESNSDKVAIMQTGSVTTTGATPTSYSTSDDIRVGNTVMVRIGARTFSGEAMDPATYYRQYIVASFDNDGAAYIARDGVVRARMNINDLYLVNMGGPVIAQQPMVGDSTYPKAVNDTAQYVEGVLPVANYVVAGGTILPKGSLVMVRSGSRNYDQSRLLTVENYTTIYSLSRVQGDHAYLAQNGVEVVDIRASDVVPTTFHVATPRQYEVFVKATWYNPVEDPAITGVTTVQGPFISVVGASALPVYTLEATAQDPGHFVRLRDLAGILSMSNARYELGSINNETNIVHGWAYTANGTEGLAQFPGAGIATKIATTFVADGKYYQADGIYIVDFYGYGHSYYRLEDIQNILGLKITIDPAEAVDLPVTGSCYDHDLNPDIYIDCL